MKKTIGTCRKDGHASGSRQTSRCGSCAHPRAQRPAHWRVFRLSRIRWARGVAANDDTWRQIGNFQTDRSVC